MKCGEKGAILGRFTSPDPMLTSGTIDAPQTWNRYSYVGNNPLRFVDPLGLWKWGASLGGDRSDDEILDELNDLENQQEKQGAENSERIAELTAILSGRQTFRNAIADLSAASTDPASSQRRRGEKLRSLNAFGTEGTDNGVSVGTGVLGNDVGAQARPTGYMYRDGQAIGARIEVTIGTHVNGKDFVMAIAHEGSHVADRQEAVAVWVASGDYNQARNGPLNLSKYSTEARAYGVSAAIAQYQNRDFLSFRTNGKSFQIWTKGMENVDRTVLNGLLAERPYQVSPSVQGDRLLP